MAEDIFLFIHLIMNVFLLPINRKLEGTSFYNFKDWRNLSYKNIIEQLKKKDGRLSFLVFYKPEDI